HRALIFSQFVDFLKMARTLVEARGLSYQYLDGSTPLPERRRRVEAFQAGEGHLFPTVEEKVLDLHETKRELADSLLAEADGASHLSTEDLLNLLQQAVAS
ncbi:MAG: helicase-related protein, partial [Candidatus Xenobia bacterium]